MRQRAAAIILKEKIFLLVTSPKIDFWFTPGGTLEEGETIEECLLRELEEELLIKDSSIKHYFDYTTKSNKGPGDIKVYCFFVEVKSEIKLSNKPEEVNELYWFSREDFVNKKLKLSDGIKNKLIPKLIEDGII